jgi:hypothetical protein
MHLVNTTSSVDTTPAGDRASGQDGDHAVERVVVRPWHDPAVAATGEDPRGEYVERFWLGVVGPSVVLLLRRLARGFDEHPPGYVISLPDTARAIGLSAGTARNSQMMRTIDRACMFGLMRRHDDELEVRTQVPRLTPRQLARLPLAVRRAHDDWLRSDSNLPPAA